MGKVVCSPPLYRPSLPDRGVGIGGAAAAAAAAVAVAVVVEAFCLSPLSPLIEKLTLAKYVKAQTPKTKNTAPTIFRLAVQIAQRPPGR